MSGDVRRLAPPVDEVNHPAHYRGGDGPECIEVMRQIASPEEFRGYLRLCAFKYLFRLGRKGAAATDAGKAEVYTRWLRESLEEETR